MTREECIENLKMIGYDGWTVTQDSYEAIQWAIEELAKSNNDASYQHTINELNKVVQEQAEEIRALKESKKMARIELLEQLKLCVAIAPEFEEMLCKDARKIVEFFDRVITQEQGSEEE